MPKGKARQWPARERLAAIIDETGGNAQAMAAVIAREMPDGLPVAAQTVRDLIRREGLRDHQQRVRARNYDKHVRGRIAGSQTRHDAARPQL